MEEILANEAEQILAKYLEMFQHNCYDFKYYFAANSVIDWFGRQIRGAQKIHEHLRHEVCTYFEHCEFRQAKLCDPIETKASHMSTQNISNKNRRNTHSKNRNCPVTTLKLYADSDIELEDYDHYDTILNRKEIPQQTVQVTQSKPYSVTNEEKIAPVKMKRSLDTSPMADSIVKFSKYNKHQKYIKAAVTERFSYLRRLPRNSTTTRENNSSDDSSSEDDDFNQFQSIYTPLQYLEVVGLLNVLPTKLYDFLDDSKCVNGSQRETRLRISYRRNIASKEVQFALVIYEDLCPVHPLMNPKRNLLSEFSFVIGDANNDDPVEVEEEGEEENDKLSYSITKDESISADLQNMSTTILSNLETDADDLESSIMMSIAQMRTPTKQTLTPAATPKRRSRSSLRRNSATKRFNESPTSSCNKRSAARSLRL